MKRIALVFGAISIRSSAYAQDAPKATPEAETPAVATLDAQNPASPVRGENSFTEAQAKERVGGKGHSDVTALTKGEDGI